MNAENGRPKKVFAEQFKKQKTPSLGLKKVYELRVSQASLLMTILFVSQKACRLVLFD